MTPEVCHDILGDEDEPVESGNSNILHALCG